MVVTLMMMLSEKQKKAKVMLGGMVTLVKEGMGVRWMVVTMKEVKMVMLMMIPGVMMMMTMLTMRWYRRGGVICVGLG